MKPEAQPLVISASRRTDIPNYYASWFLERLRNGYVLVRNVRDYHRVRRIDLSVEAVACIVFWTKNPAPLLPFLAQLNGYPDYFQYTITGYGLAVEPRIPPVGESVDRFKQIADRIGNERVIWRYDPIFNSKDYPLGYHMEMISYLASQLKGYTKRCVFSFLDRYPHIEESLQRLGIEEIDEPTMRILANHIAMQCRENGIAVQSCAEPYDLEDVGITHGACIDTQLVETLSGIALSGKKDRLQRPHCRCAPSVDIGMYNTCLSHCPYCYANHHESVVHAQYAKARSTSEFLIGSREEGDVIETLNAVDKKVQLSLFGDVVD